MNKTKYLTFSAVALGFLLLGIIFFFQISFSKATAHSIDHKNITYSIGGDRVQLKDGLAEVEAAPNSASKIITQYFGNELKADFNGDGREDVAFVVTQTTGGSGTFFYAVAALNTPDGYVGSDGYLLGDRIAPQSITLSPDATQKGVVVFNFVDRAVGEPMSAQPSVGNSVYLKLNPQTARWAEEQRVF